MLDLGFAKQEIENQARQALEQMINELYGTNAGKVQIAAGNIIFQVPVGYDGSGNMLWGAESGAGNKIQFILDTNSRTVLRRILDSSNNPIANYPIRVLSSNTQNLVFTISGSTLDISITNQKNARWGPLSHTQSSKVNFRN
jgi:hypothetical protein